MKPFDIMLPFLPVPVRQRLQRLVDSIRLNRIPPEPVHTASLRPAACLDVCRILEGAQSDEGWLSLRHTIERLGLSEGSGGVNRGDQRGIYHLIRHFKPSSVLEVGTHIGASTVHIASAMQRNQAETGQDIRLVTVDIADVNDPVDKPWLRYGATHSPATMIREIGAEPFVRFVNQPSLHFMHQCPERFDLIFLDGDHSASTVYREVPAALRLLNENGVILMHDYYPDLRPLWTDGSVISGPYLATARLVREGAQLCVAPLGAWAWPSKQNSNATSVALLLRSS
jgi:predicted O-methyltransferase YrrM